MAHDQATWMSVAYISCRFSRVVPGSATLQRGVQHRADLQDRRGKLQGQARLNAMVAEAQETVNNALAGPSSGPGNEPCFGVT